MTMTDHTPTPWRSVDFIVAAGVELIAVLTAGEANNGCVSPPIARANAVFIVRAVNAHDELVAALRGCLNALNTTEAALWSAEAVAAAHTALRHATED